MVDLKQCTSIPGEAYWEVLCICSSNSPLLYSGGMLYLHHLFCIVAYIWSRWGLRKADVHEDDVKHSLVWLSDLRASAGSM